MHAPHRVHTVFINDNGFVPAHVDEQPLRAEVYMVDQNRKIFLTLSDFYADEYIVNMGPDTPQMLKFVQGLVADRVYCTIKAHLVTRKEGGSFRKPVVSVTPGRTSFFK